MGAGEKEEGEGGVEGKPNDDWQMCGLSKVQRPRLAAGGNGAKPS